MEETRRKVDQDFKEGAVRLVRETGGPIAQVAKDLGINEGTLGNSRVSEFLGDGAGAEGARQGWPGGAGWLPGMIWRGWPDGAASAGPNPPPMTGGSGGAAPCEPTHATDLAGAGGGQPPGRSPRGAA